MSSTDASARPATRAVDLITFGETMVAFVAHGDPHDVVATVAGAESNLAAGMAVLGCRTRWVSRLGDDPLGRLIVDDVTSRGVDVRAELDPIRPTGILTRHLAGGRTVVRYYRSESAARMLGPEAVELAGDASWFHLTGITPALSRSTAELVEAVVDRSREVRSKLSFDVNFRPVLWPTRAAAAEHLLSIARRADVVFIGDDESEALFGTSTPEAVAELILCRDDQELVFKRGPGAATVITGHEVITEPARVSTMSDPTGAGDAFASGYLAGHVFGRTASERLRLAHHMGARAVGVLDDMPRPIGAAELVDLTRAGLLRTSSEP